MSSYSNNQTMSRRAEKEALKIIREKHERKYDAPMGKRRCRYRVSEDCLKLGNERDRKGTLQWRGQCCKPCMQHRYREWYDQRVEARGGRQKVGRKPLSESEKKKRAALRMKSGTRK
jgi:hypothetical protein